MVGAGYGQMGRVLIVDDDPGVCAIIAEILGEEGIEVACAQNDSAAYAMIPTLPNFRALVVDVDLGQGTTGFDVARFARKVIPDLPVIYISGAASNAHLEAFGVPESQFLQKPFTSEKLCKCVWAQWER